MDSEVLLTQLKGNGKVVEQGSGSDKANIVIVNTCGFIDAAKQESINTILSLASEKEKGSLDKLYVTGCLSERYRDELKKEIPQVNAFFGTRELPDLLKALKADYKHELLGDRITSTSHYAYLKISEGCDRPCSFCAIPIMRGKHVSRPMEQLVQEARSLVTNGVKELLLIAQDSTYYGLDIYGKRLLAELLNRLSDVEGLEWIRLHYSYPSGFPYDVLEVIREKPNICNYLDLPLQHGSTRMLQLMRRGMTRESTEQLLNDIRERVPDIALRTTLIVGHPGESSDDFEEMMDFVEKSRFDRLGVFTYSHEENTHSYKMNDDVADQVKQERADHVMELQEGISLQINKTRINSEMRVLIDRVEGEFFVGRTEYDSPEVDNEVLIDSKQHYLRVGDFANIKMVDATAFDLYGVPIS